MSELTATNELVAASSRAVGSPRGGAASGATVLTSIKSFVGQPAVARSLPMLGLLGMLAAAVLVWMSFSAAPGRDLFHGLPDEDKAAVAEALKSAGVAYEIDRDTGAITVGDDDYHEARMLLASQGLPKSAPNASDMLGNVPMGASRAVEGERLRGAREADLARTIEAIDAVQSARVHLAISEQSVFLRSQNRGAASVMLRLAPGRSLGDAQVQAIVHLVASSVSSLSPSDVSVVDQSGRLLSGQGGGGASDASDRQVAVQSRIEERYRESLASLLTPIVGDGNFTAEVHADVDFSETQATREDFPKEATALTSEENSFTTNGGPVETGGIPGALSNAAPPAAQVASAPSGAITPTPPNADEASVSGNGKTQQNLVRSFAVGRQVSVTKQQIGQVKRLTVAVALKNPEGAKPRSKEEIAAIENLIKGAIGYDQSRGDMVALSARNFAKIEESTPSWWEAGWVSMAARNLTALAMAVLLIFGVGRPMLRKGSEIMSKRAETVRSAKPNVRGEIAAAISGHKIDDPDGTITLDMIEAAPGYEARAALIRNFVRQDPARAALVVRDLIRAEKEGAERNG